MSYARHFAIRYTSAIVLAVLVLAGITLRLWMISISPLDARYSNADDGDYYRRALRLATTGSYLDDSWLIRPPGHILLFAACLRVVLLLGIPQYGVLSIQLLQTALAALATLLAFGVAQRMFGSARAGIAFAAFVALWFPFVEGATVLFTEQIYLFLFLLHVWLLLRHDARARGWLLATAGLALGGAALVRSPALYAVVFVLPWLVWQAPGAISFAGRKLQIDWPLVRRAIGRWLVVVAGCLAIVAPWTLRNYVTYGHLIPVDTLGQVNLWLDLDLVENRNTHIQTLREMPQADRAPYAMAQARAIIIADPARPFRQIWPTFQHVWKMQFVEDYYVKQDFFGRVLRESAWLGLTGDLFWLVALLCGAWGVVGPLHEGLGRRLFFGGWLAFTMVTVLIFHVEPRYLLPLWTLLALYAAGVVGRIGSTTTVVRPLRVVQMAVTLVIVALLVSYRDYPQIIARGVAREAAMRTGIAAYQRGEYPAAARAFQQAGVAQPGFVDARVHETLALAAQHEYAAAYALAQQGGSRRADLLLGAVARARGESTRAAEQLTRIEAIAGENIQHWAMAWLRPAATRSMTLGDGLDIGYIDGFSPAETDATHTFRWLEGQGRLRLPLPVALAPGTSLTITANGGLPGTTLLDVRVGAGSWQRVPVQNGGWRTYHIPLDTPPGSTVVDVELRAPTFVPALRDPASTDARALSLMIAHVGVQ